MSGCVWAGRDLDHSCWLWGELADFDGRGVVGVVLDSWVRLCLDLTLLVGLVVW